MNLKLWKTPRSVDLLIVIGISIFVYVRVLQLNQPTERDRQSKCSSNLRQLELGMLIYTQSNNGQYPPSLEIMPLVEDTITPADLICPDSTDTPAAGATKQELAANLQKPGHCSYIYLGEGLTTEPRQRTR